MDDFSGQTADQLPRLAAHGDHSPAHLQPDLAQHAQDVASGLGGIGTDHEIGPAQEKEMQGVILNHEGVVDQLADGAGGRRRLDLIQVVQSLGGGHVMGHGTDAADARSDLWRVFDRSAHLFPGAREPMGPPG